MLGTPLTGASWVAEAFVVGQSPVSFPEEQEAGWEVEKSELKLVVQYGIMALQEAV